jgi:hypothetical protein
MTNVYVMALHLFIGPWPLSQFLNPTYSRQDSLDGGSARDKADATHKTSTPRVGFEHTTLVFRRTKTVHGLESAATVNGRL